MRRLALTYRRLRRMILGRRRLLSALAAAVAVAAGLSAVNEPPPPTSQVLTAARDLPSGTVVRASDLRPVGFSPDSVPSGVLTRSASAVGRTTAAPVRSGEPITDVRLVEPSLLAGYPGLVAVPVRIGDPATVSLLRIGDRIDVLGADPQGRADVQLVASQASVVALPRTADTDQSTSLVPGGLVILAVPDQTARALAAASVTRFLSVVLSP